MKLGNKNKNNDISRHPQTKKIVFSFVCRLAQTINKTQTKNTKKSFVPNDKQAEKTKKSFVPNDKQTEKRFFYFIFIKILILKYEFI